MSSLLLIRHGQGSLLKANYDQLSQTGEAQCQALAEYWAQRQLHFDEVITGPRNRHLKTAALIGQHFNDQNLNWPAPIENAGFDEHQIDQLLLQHREGLFRQSPQVAQLGKELLQTPRSSPEFNKRLHTLLAAVIALWIKGDKATQSIESWTDFRARVIRAIQTILLRGKQGQQIVVFTSSGVIAAALQHALECSDDKATNLGWRIRNASITEFVFSPGRFTLDSFNGLPHLPSPNLWTYL